MTDAAAKEQQRIEVNQWLRMERPPRLSGLIDDEAITRPATLAKARNDYARELLSSRLPRLLHRLIDRPRALELVLRAFPRWRPTMTYIECRDGMRGGHFHTMTAEGARQFAATWIQGAREQGHPGLDGGLIFIYTDPSGLPAEIHAPRLLA